ncbi:MAG: hypothetical protein ACQESJ_09150 [Bacteroidota bacterium]
MKKILLFYSVITALLISGCYADSESQNVTKVSCMEKNVLSADEINPGNKIICIKELERKMKDSDEHIKYTVKIYGTVEKKEGSDIFIKVGEVSSVNLKKKNKTWVKNDSVVKKPPYVPGRTYEFKEKNKTINDAVSTGYYKIYFIQSEKR